MQSHPLAIAATTNTRCINQTSRLCVSLKGPANQCQGITCNRLRIPATKRPPRPVHMEVATTAAPRQNARLSPLAKRMPVISQPETTIQNAPRIRSLKAVGRTTPNPQSAAKAVVPTYSVRRRNCQPRAATGHAGLLIPDPAGLAASTGSAGDGSSLKFLDIPPNYVLDEMPWYAASLGTRAILTAIQKLSASRLARRMPLSNQRILPATSPIA